MIYKRGKRWRVIVYAGRDPITGRKRQKSITVDTRAEAKQAQARLFTEVGAGQHRGSANRTVGELLDRWLEWRQSVRPISPTTVATYRGYIDRSIRPTLGKLQLARLDAAALDAFYAHLRKQGGKGGRPMAASSVHQVHAILSGALNRAVVWGRAGHADGHVTLATYAHFQQAQDRQAAEFMAPIVSGTWSKLR